MLPQSTLGRREMNDPVCCLQCYESAENQVENRKTDFTDTTLTNT